MSVAWTMTVYCWTFWGQGREETGVSVGSSLQATCPSGPHARSPRPVPAGGRHPQGPGALSAPDRGRTLSPLACGATARLGGPGCFHLGTPGFGRFRLYVVSTQKGERGAEGTLPRGAQETRDGRSAERGAIHGQAESPPAALRPVSALAACNRVPSVRFCAVISLLSAPSPA